jgi:ABC-2 type transport system permease protein
LGDPVAVRLHVGLYHAQLGRSARADTGLLGLTILFGTSSMEAIVITFERHTGAFERLLLAPVRLPALLAGKMLGGMVFGLTVTLAVLMVVLIAFGADGVNWPMLFLALLFSAAAFSALGAFVSELV